MIENKRRHSNIAHREKPLFGLMEPQHYRDAVNALARFGNNHIAELERQFLNRFLHFPDFPPNRRVVDSWH